MDNYQKRCFLLAVILFLLGITLWITSAKPVYAEVVNSTTTITATEDDGREVETDTNWDATSVTLGIRDGSGFQYDGAFRFNNLLINPGSEITEASITLNSSLTTTNYSALRIYAEATDNCATFNSGSRYPTNLSLTTSNQDWTPTSWVLNNDYKSPDLTTIIQEIIDRPGWASGNSICIVIMDVQGFDNVDRRQYAYDYGTDTAKSARLHLVYNNASLSPYSGDINCVFDNPDYVCTPTDSFWNSVDVLVGSSTNHIITENDNRINYLFTIFLIFFGIFMFFIIFDFIYKIFSRK